MNILSGSLEQDQHSLRLFTLTSSVYTYSFQKASVLNSKFKSESSSELRFQDTRWIRDEENRWQDHSIENVGKTIHDERHLTLGPVLLGVLYKKCASTTNRPISTQVNTRD